MKNVEDAVALTLFFAGLGSFITYCAFNRERTALPPCTCPF